MFLFQKNSNVKITDFGLARAAVKENYESFKRLVGTTGWVAPELMNSMGFSTKSDVYSVGVIIWEITYRVVNGLYQAPYKEYPELKLDFQILTQAADKKLRPTIPITTKPAIADIIQRSWSHEPENRPLFTEVISVIQASQQDYALNKESWDNTVTLQGLKLLLQQGFLIDQLPRHNSKKKSIDLKL